MFEAVFINGTVGAGKTTTAVVLSSLLSEQGDPHAIVDLDQIRLLFPPPAVDPFQHELELVNLRDIATNYRAAGAAKLIVAGVLETPQEIPRYIAALGVTSLLVCRLLVRADTVRARLRHRHADDIEGLRWHLGRTTELSGVLDRAHLDDVEIDTTDREPKEIAAELGRHAGWVGVERI